MIDSNVACIRIRGNRSFTMERRIPVHFCIAIDVSGSMAIDLKLENVKRSIHYILEILTDADMVSIVTFSNRATHVIQRSATTDDNTAILQQRVRSLNPDGGTNLSDGILATRDCLLAPGTAYKQGILLLTDGQANSGVTDPAQIVQMVSSLLAEFNGTTLSCVGYGTDHNGDLLRAIAREGSGSYSVVQNLEDVATVFGDILGGLISCGFQQVAVKIPRDASQISHYPMDTSAHTTIRIGDLQDESEIAVIVRDVSAGQDISVQGYNVRELQFTTTTLPIQADATPEEILHGKITYLRCEVVRLMEDVRTAVASNRSMESREPLLRTVARLRELATSYGTELPQVQMILEELDVCERTLNTPLRTMHEHEHATQILTQRTACMASGRGVRNAYTPGRPLEAQVSQSPHTALFSNNLQRALSEALRDSTQVADADPDADADPFMGVVSPHEPRIQEALSSLNPMSATHDIIPVDGPTLRRVLGHSPVSTVTPMEEVD